MSVRRLRHILTYLVVILATLVAVLFFFQWKNRSTSLEGASEVVRLCDLPELPEGLTARHVAIDASDNPELVDVILTLTGPTEILVPWLEKVDKWEKKRPGKVLNYKIRESEYSSRVDFTAEVYLK
jgi:hypothetical protein